MQGADKPANPWTDITLGEATTMLRIMLGIEDHDTIIGFKVQVHSHGPDGVCDIRVFGTSENWDKH